MFNKIKTKSLKVKEYFKNGKYAIAAGLVVHLSNSEVFASGLDQTLMKSIVNIVLDLFKSIGIALLLWGLGQLFLAFKNEDADSKSRAIMVVVASVALIGLETVFDQLNVWG